MDFGYPRSGYPIFGNRPLSGPYQAKRAVHAAGGDHAQYTLHSLPTGCGDNHLSLKFQQRRRANPKSDPDRFPADFGDPYSLLSLRLSPTQYSLGSYAAVLDYLYLYLSTLCQSLSLLDSIKPGSTFASLVTYWTPFAHRRALLQSAGVGTRRTPLVSSFTILFYPFVCWVGSPVRPVPAHYLLRRCKHCRLTAPLHETVL